MSTTTEQPTQGRFSVGDTAYYPRFQFEKDEKTVKYCEVRELRVSTIIPNYLNKLGLRYGAHRLGKPLGEMAYMPESLFSSHEDAKQALRASVMERIAHLTEALNAIA